MLAQFGDTLKTTSEDTDNHVFMTSCQTKVVNFDNFKKYVARKHSIKEPMSCDALYRCSNSNWFFIEFKNGKIEDKMYGKIYESILLLIEGLNYPIDFIRNNVSFILVHNKTHYRKHIQQQLLWRVVVSRLPKLYLKDVFMYDTTDFDNEFVKKYGL